ncbi:hypothetical protein ACTXT7_007492 [Hymenolepis weldensis]
MLKIIWLQHSSALIIVCVDQVGVHEIDAHRSTSSGAKIQLPGSIVTNKMSGQKRVYFLHPNQASKLLNFSSTRLDSQSSFIVGISASDFRTSLLQDGKETETVTEGLMPDTTITDEMGGHPVIVSIKAKHRDLEIAGFLKVPDLSFEKLGRS